MEQGYFIGRKSNEVAVLMDKPPKNGEKNFSTFAIAGDGKCIDIQEGMSVKVNKVKECK